MSILDPILTLQPLLAIIIISLIVAIIITVAYKLMTDQRLLKELKDDIKKFQKEMKDFKENPKKVMEIQKKAMEKNMQYMLHSIKPTIVTLLPIIFIFGWLNAHYAYNPIMPDQKFTTTVFFNTNTKGQIELIVPEGIELLSDSKQEINDDKAEWALKGKTGGYILKYRFKDKDYSKELQISEKREYKNPIKKIKNNEIKKIEIDMEPLKPLNLFGWRIGWLGTYIIFSIIFSTLLKKLMRLH